MILILDEKEVDFVAFEGDSFNLCFDTGNLHETLLSKKITKRTVIDYIAIYRFVNEHCECTGDHLSGMFGQKNNLPEEFKSAKRLNDLSSLDIHRYNTSLGE